MEAIYMAQTNLSIRMDAGLKEEFDQFCKNIGMTMSTAVNVFAKKAVAEARIPFEIGIEKPNRTTIDAIEEVELMEKYPERYRGYATAEEMMQDILG